jgi:hypothetical protein
MCSRSWVRVFASCAVDHEFKARSGQTKDYKNGICCFSTKHAVLRRKSKDWLARNQDNQGDMSICRLLFKSASTTKIQLSVLVLYKVGLIFISSNVTCSRHDMTEKVLIWCHIIITHSLCR